MDSSRRRFLVHLGQFAALGGTGLLAACQGQQQPITVTSAPAAPTQPPTTKPAIAPAASPGAAASPSAAASPAAAASPGAVAKPSPSPGVSASPVAGGGAGAGKPQYQMDAQHSGRSPHAGPRRLGLLRSINLADPAIRPTDTLLPSSDIQSSTAVGADGTIYATLLGGPMFALRDGSAANQLEMAWQYHPVGGAAFHATPAIARDGTVYCPFTTGAGPEAKGALYALKAPSSGRDGQVVWQADLGAGTVQNSPTVGPDDTIYITNTSGLLSAIDSSGHVKWTAQFGTSGQAQFGQTVKVAPALANDGTVYVTALTGSLYAISPPSGSGNQGTIKWTFDFGQHLGSTPLISMPVTAGPNRGQDAIGSAASATIGPDGTIYVGANNSNFYAIDPNGQQKWLYEAERELAGIWTTAALSADNSTLYFGANKGGVYALNANNGSLKWKSPVYGSIYGSSALDSRGTVYTGTTIGQVIANDASNGQVIATYDSAEAVWTAPSIRPSGTLVVGDRSGKILVLGESS